MLFGTSIIPTSSVLDLVLQHACCSQVGSQTWNWPRIHYGDAHSILSPKHSHPYADTSFTPPSSSYASLPLLLMVPDLQQQQRYFLPMDMLLLDSAVEVVPVSGFDSAGAAPGWVVQHLASSAATHFFHNSSWAHLWMKKYCCGLGEQQNSWIGQPLWRAD